MGELYPNHNENVFCNPVTSDRIMRIFQLQRTVRVTLVTRSNAFQLVKHNRQSVQVYGINVQCTSYSFVEFPCVLESYQQCVNYFSFLQHSDPSTQLFYTESPLW